MKPVALSEVIESTQRTRHIANQNIEGIRSVTRELQVLALNAVMEASRAGHHGRGFGVVAQEVKNISSAVQEFAERLARDLGGEISALDQLTRRMASEASGSRLVDLSLNAIELIDRNLYERTCDVRWWATDSAIVEAAASPTPEATAYAAKRMGVILQAYTVYLDIWLCDLNGKVLANGRPDTFQVSGQSVADRPWFRHALQLRDGNSYVAGEVTREPSLANAEVATYAASVRQDGESKGRPLGILAIHFDWQPQARSIVHGVRLTGEEKARTRVLLVDQKNLVLASSDGRGALSERLPIDLKGRQSGFEQHNNVLYAFHRTPGYETYKGLGWYGVIVQSLA